MAEKGDSDEKPEGVEETVDVVADLLALGKIPGGRGGKKLSKFMAQETQIRKALASGFSVKDVYEYLRGRGLIDLSYSLFSLYVRTKLQLRPRQGFEEVRIVGDREAGALGSELTEEERRHNEMVYGHPERPQEKRG